MVDVEVVHSKSEIRGHGKTARRMIMVSESVYAFPFPSVALLNLWCRFSSWYLENSLHNLALIQHSDHGLGLISCEHSKTYVAAGVPFRDWLD